MKVLLPDSAGNNIEYEIFPLEYKNISVLSTKQLALFFDSSRQNISINFRRHMKDFVEGVDYFYLHGITLKVFILGYTENYDRQAINLGRRAENLGRRAENYVRRAEKSGWKDEDPCNFWTAVAPQAHDLYLWTKTGARKHALYLNTDMANKVFISLLDTYFAPTEDFKPPVQTSLFADEPLTVEISAKEPSTVETTPCDTRIELLTEFIRLCKNDDLRDTLIREAASLILGKQI